MRSQKGHPYAKTHAHARAHVNQNTLAVLCCFDGISSSNTSCLRFVGRDLRALLSLLKRQGSVPSTHTPPHAPLLLHTLCTMARHKGPSAFFDFANESAGILPTTPLHLPTSKGYSFATWLRIEEGSGHPSGTAGRALYALLHRSGDIRGVIASFTGGWSSFHPHNVYFKLQTSFLLWKSTLKKCLGTVKMRFYIVEMFELHVELVT